MTPEQLQALLGGIALPGGSAPDTSALFGPLRDATQPLADFDSVEYREQLYHGFSDAFAQFTGSIPEEARNFSDPSGNFRTFSESGSSTTTTGSVFLRTTTETDTLNEGVVLGEGTPLQTSLTHDVENSNSSTTVLGREVSNSESFTESFGVENELVKLGLTHSDNDINALGQNIVTTNTTLGAELGGMFGAEVSLSSLALNGEGLDLLTVSYPNIEGGQDSLLLPASTNVLVPLALGIAEGFVANPDPTAILDTLTGVAELPEPIGSIVGGGNPLGGLPIPELPA